MSTHQPSPSESAFYKVLQLSFFSPNAFRLRTERRNLEFVPGQCVNIGLPKSGVNREYSTYSSVREQEWMEFLIRRVDGGSVSDKLSKLVVGDNVEIHGAYGSFVLPSPEEAKKNEYVFIATGTGIAPFHSFAFSYPEIRYTILHGVRELKEQYDKEFYPEGRYLSCVSQEKINTSDKNTFQGRVTDYLKQKSFSKEAVYYLCGNRAMINEVYDLLRDQGVSGDKLITEVFF
jgi:NAD(P)H-flavin reductase